MEYLKNLPEVPASLAGLIEIRPGRVVSMALSKVDHLQLTLFAFAEGEGVSSEIYPGDTWFQVLEGTALLRRDGHEYELQAGDCVAVPAGTAHSLECVSGGFKLLQLQVSKG